MQFADECRDAEPGHFCETHRTLHIDPDTMDMVDTLHSVGSTAAQISEAVDIPPEEIRAYLDTQGKVKKPGTVENLWVASRKAKSEQKERDLDARLEDLKNKTAEPGQPGYDPAYNQKNAWGFSQRDLDEEAAKLAQDLKKSWSVSENFRVEAEIRAEILRDGRIATKQETNHRRAVKQRETRQRGFTNLLALGILLK